MNVFFDCEFTNIKAKIELIQKQGVNMQAEANPCLDEILSLATDVFGSPEKAQEWLTSNNLALGYPPVDLLSTADGAAEVRKILSAISKGGVV